MELYSVFMDTFDQEKPYAEVTVLEDGVSALGKIRRKGDVILVNYGSDVWESTVDQEGNSYFTNTDRFKVRRVEPVKDTTKNVVIEVPDEVPLEEAEVVVEEGSDAITLNAVEVVPDTVEEPVKPATRGRRASNKTAK